MAKEIEYKFLLNQSNVEQLLDAPELARYAAEAPRDKRVVSTYYDTPDAWIRRHKMGLRLRQKGDQWLQTLKGDAVAQDGRTVREEVELKLPGPQLNMDLFLNTAFDAVARDEAVVAQIAPVFVTDFVRRTWDLVLADGTKVEVALDRGDVIAGEKREPILELELELVSGEVASMDALAVALRDTYALPPGSRSKAQRGYDLMAS